MQMRCSKIEAITGTWGRTWSVAAVSEWEKPPDDLSLLFVSTN